MFLETEEVLKWDCGTSYFIQIMSNNVLTFNAQSLQLLHFILTLILVFLSKETLILGRREYYLMFNANSEAMDYTMANENRN